MENAADALKMAGAVLLFVLALSIILFYFGQVRESADTILDYRDRETMYIDGNYYYEQTGTERNVNLETIVPSVYRAYLENYKIILIQLAILLLVVLKIYSRKLQMQYLEKKLRRLLQRDSVIKLNRN